VIHRFRPEDRERCPHCGTTVQFVLYGSSAWYSPIRFEEVDEEGPSFEIHGAKCPFCNRPVVSIEMYHLDDPHEQPEEEQLVDSWLIWPIASARPPIPTRVPGNISNDYREAAMVLHMSEKASAALSRRCLQAVLHDVAATKSKDLVGQIEEVLPKLPGYLQQQLDAVRNIGNFAAHPQKSKATGEIIDVERGEAEWNLDVLDLLFDFYYEQPRIAQEKRDALNKKLAAAAKPPMK
jgi:Domain of unknown function (DUF4145)